MSHLRAARTEAIGACNHLTNLGRRMMSGSAKRLYRKGCTSSGLSGPPRFKSSTPSFSSWPLPKACAAGVRALSPLLFDLPHSQLFPAATIRWLVLVVRHPPPTRRCCRASLPSLLLLLPLGDAVAEMLPTPALRLLCAVGEKGGDGDVPVEEECNDDGAAVVVVEGAPTNQALATESEHRRVAAALIFCWRLIFCRLEVPCVLPLPLRFSAAGVGLCVRCRAAVSNLCACEGVSALDFFTPLCKQEKAYFPHRWDPTGATAKIPQLTSFCLSASVCKSLFLSVRAGRNYVCSCAAQRSAGVTHSSLTHNREFHLIAISHYGCGTREIGFQRSPRAWGTTRDSSQRMKVRTTTGRGTV